jgi:hypothetical protein
MPRTGEDLSDTMRRVDEPLAGRVKPGEGNPTVHPDRALGFIYAAAFTPSTTTTPK